MHFLYTPLISLILGLYSCDQEHNNIDLSQQEVDLENLNDNTFVEKNSNYIPFDKSYYQNKRKALMPGKKYHKLIDKKSMKIAINGTHSPENSSEELPEVKAIISDLKFYPESISTVNLAHITSTTPSARTVTHSIFSENFITYNRLSNFIHTTFRPEYSLNSRISKVKWGDMKQQDTKKKSGIYLDFSKGIMECYDCLTPKTTDKTNNPIMFFNSNLN